MVVPVSRRIVLLISTLVLLMPAHVSAQVARDLPETITQSPSALSADQERQVREFVQAHIADLMSDDLIRIRRARQALQRQVAVDGNRRPTPSFRFAYSTAIVSDLERMLASSEAIQRIVALYLAGSIATERTAQLPLAALNDPDASVRYAAGSSLGLVFQAIRRSPPAVRNIPGLIDAIGTRLGEEHDPFVLDRLIVTLRLVTDAGPEGALSEHRGRALDAIATRMGQTLRTQPSVDIERLRAILRAGEVVQSAFTAGLFSERGDHDASIVLAAGFAGDSLTLVARMVKDGGLDDQTRDLLAKIAATSEATIFFAQGAHSGSRGTPTPQGVATRLANGDDSGFLDALRRAYTGPEGVLTKAPFSLPVDRFSF